MKRIISALVVLCVFAIPAFALSDAEYLRMKKNRDFAEADKELTRVYNEAKDKMSYSAFTELRKSQREWVKTGRDRQARELIRDGETRLNAYTEVTLQRVTFIKNAIGDNSLDNSEDNSSDDSDDSSEDNYSEDNSSDTGKFYEED